MTFDLDAVVAEGEGEDHRESFGFTFGGEHYELPAHMDIVAAAALASGQPIGLTKMLGDEQWNRLLASPAVLDQAKLEALMEAYGAHVGVSPGELAASTDS